MKIDERALEAAARAECTAEDVDPEHECGGLGNLIPVGETWPAWKVRLKRLTAAIEAYEAARPDPNPWRPITDDTIVDGHALIWADDGLYVGHQALPRRWLPRRWQFGRTNQDLAKVGAQFRTIDPPS